MTERILNTATEANELLSDSLIDVLEDWEGLGLDSSIIHEELLDVIPVIIESANDDFPIAYVDSLETTHLLKYLCTFPPNSRYRIQENNDRFWLILKRPLGSKESAFIKDWFYVNFLGYFLTDERVDQDLATVFLKNNPRWNKKKYMLEKIDEYSTVWNWEADS